MSVPTGKRQRRMAQRIGKGAVENLAKVSTRQVSVPVVVASSLHRPVLKLKHFVSVRPAAANYATASGERRIAELHRADGLISILLTNGIELWWRRWFERRGINGLPGEHCNELRRNHKHVESRKHHYVKTKE